LHNDELHNLYSSPNIVTVIKSRTVRCTGHVARIGGRGEVLVGRPEGVKIKGHWEALGHRWEDNIKMDLRE
jgi:hypothetical protein